MYADPTVTPEGSRSLHFRGMRPIPRLPELASSCARPAAALRDIPRRSSPPCNPLPARRRPRARPRPRPSGPAWPRSCRRRPGWRTRCRRGRSEACRLRSRWPGLKGSVGEGPNQTNYSDRSSVRILAKFKKLNCEKNSKNSEILLKKFFSKILQKNCEHWRTLANIGEHWRTFANICEHFAQFCAILRILKLRLFF